MLTFLLSGDSVGVLGRSAGDGESPSLLRADRPHCQFTRRTSRGRITSRPNEPVSNPSTPLSTIDRRELSLTGSRFGVRI